MIYTRRNTRRLSSTTINAMHGTWATWQQLYLFDSLAWSNWAHSNGSLDHIKWWNCFRWRSLQYLCSWRLSSLVGIAIRIGTNFVGCTEDIDVSMKNLVSLGWWVVLGIFTVVSCFQVPWHFFFAPLSLMLFGLFHAYSASTPSQVLPV